MYNNIEVDFLEAILCTTRRGSNIQIKSSKNDAI